MKDGVSLAGYAMTKYTYEEILCSNDSRESYILNYERFTRELKRFGFLEAYLIHNKNLNAIKQDLMPLN
jgi:hypothetical protein